MRLRPRAGLRPSAQLAETVRWSPPGEATYRFEARPAEWPTVATDARTAAAVDITRADVG